MNKAIQLPELSRFEIKSVWIYCPNSALDGWLLPQCLAPCLTYAKAHRLAKIGRATYKGHLFAVLPMGWKPIITAF